MNKQKKKSLSNKSELESVKERLETIYENAPDAIYITDLKGRIIDGNRTAVKMTGYKKEQMIGRKTNDFLAAKDLKKSLTGLKENREGKPAGPEEFTFITKGGKELILEDKSYPITIGKKKFILGIARDVTEKKKLEELKDKFTFISNITGEMVSLINKKYIYEAVNDAYCSAFRKKKDEIIGEYVKDIWSVKVFHSHIEKNLDNCFKGQYVSYKNWFVYGKLGMRYMDVSYYPYKDHLGGISNAVVISKDLTAEKLAEEAKAKTESLYKKTIDALHEWIYVLDKDLKILSVNNAVIRTSKALGLSEKICGMNLKKVCPFMSKKDYKKYFDVLRLKKTIKTVDENEFNGKKMYVEVSRIPVIENGKVEKIVNVIRDITSRVDYENSIRRNEERFRSLFEASNDAVFIYLLDGTVINSNKKATKLLGYSKEEFLKMKVLQFHYLEDIEKSIKAFKEIRKKGSVQFETKFKHKNGKVIDVDISSAFVDRKNSIIQGVVRDITDKKKAETRLLASERKHRNLLESISDSVYVLDKNWVYVMANDEVSDFTKIPKNKLIGGKLTDLFPGIEKTVFFKVYKRVMESGIPEVVSGPYIFRDGIRNWCEAAVYPLPEGIMCISRDITKQKKAEQERENMYRKLIHSEKMAGIGTLAAGVAHEFNNILQMMRGNTELAVRTQKKEDMREALEIVLDTTKRASKIIKNMLSFSQESSGIMQMSDMVDILESVLPLMEHDLRKRKINIIRDYSKIPQTALNRSEMQQVFFNIISNAGDSMASSDERNLFVSAKAEEDRIIIEFKDTGIGIKEENIDKIFDAFYTTKGLIGGGKEPGRGGEGTGLGLSISYGIIKRHGGLIEAESVYGKGTTFKIKLPVREVANRIDSAKSPETLKISSVPEKYR